MAKITTAFVYKWVHKPTLKYYIGSRTAKGCHPNDGYICSSKRLKANIIANPQEWQRSIIAIGNPDDMWNLETEILQTFDCANDPRSFNKHNNTGLIRGQSGEKNPTWGMKRPDLSQRNKQSKGIPKPNLRGPRPQAMGTNNVMAREEVKIHHRNQVLKAMQDPAVKEKHRAANKIAQNKPEVKEASSKRMIEYRQDPKVKQKYSELFSGNNNPSKKYKLTCPNCFKTMAIGMYVRWGHGNQCAK